MVGPNTWYAEAVELRPPEPRFPGSLFLKHPKSVLSFIGFAGTLKVFKMLPATKFNNHTSAARCQPGGVLHSFRVDAAVVREGRQP